MALGRFTGKSLLFLTMIAVAYSSPEVHTFSVRFKNETINGVAETDVQNNWISHHVFPSSQAPGVTIARDHNLGVEVFVPDRQKDVCYAREIEEGTQTPLEIQAELEVIEEHHQTIEVSDEVQNEYLECTGEQVDPAKLGRVKFLCRNKPIFRLRKIKRTKRAPRLIKSGCWWCHGCRSNKREVLAMKSCLRMVYIKTCDAPDKAE